MTTVRTALVSLVALLLTATGAAAEIRIAVAGPMSGSLATLGAQIRDGAAAAVAAINAAGGLLGEEVVLDIADDGCSEDRADDIANQLAGAGVVMVVGHLCSAAAIAASAVYAAEGIIQIAPGAPDPRFTDERPGDGIFRLFGREDEQGPTAAAFLASLPQEAAIAVIDDLSAYGVRLADSVVEALEAANRPAALVQSYSIANPDFAGLVEGLQEAGIGAVFVGGTAEDIAALRLVMADQDYSPILVGGDVLASQTYSVAAGEAADGILFTYPPDPRLDPAASTAIAAITATGGDSAGFALYAYAAVEVWAAAVAEAGTTNATPVASAIAGGPFDTALGAISFTGGNVSYPGWVIYAWDSGEITVFSQ